MMTSDDDSRVMSVERWTVKVWIVCRGRRVRHVNLIVIESLSPTRPHPNGLLLLFLLNIKTSASSHRVLRMPCQLAAAAFLFSFSITSRQTPTVTAVWCGV